MTRYHFQHSIQNLQLFFFGEHRGFTGRTTDDDAVNAPFEQPGAQ
jgi:hypothetical protein